ncbi:MAG: trigger factor [Micromonosporaceae bacterium]|nr:trigger factor [Micromonosporaceae bacterium]
MKSTVETLGPTRVRLAIEVPFAELEPTLKKAYREVAQQVSIPGFRRGKVPAAVIDQRVGRETVLNEAVQEVIPQQLVVAIQEHQVKTLGRPEVDNIEVDDGQPLRFTAEVDIRPEITLPDLSEISVTVDEIKIEDGDLDQEVGSLRERFATLKTVERAAATGDFVQIDLSATVQGTPVEGGTATNLSHEVGSQNLLPGLDDVLVGMSDGDSTSFVTALLAGEHAGQDADVAVTVRTVKEKELPPLDDDFAQLASEFDTLDELRADVREQLTRRARTQQIYAARDKTLAELVSRSGVPAPEGVVRDEVSHRKEHLSEELERVGRSLAEYLSLEEKTEAEIDAELTEAAAEGVKIQLLLDTLAEAEKVPVSDEEYGQEIVGRAQRVGIEPQQYYDQLVRAGAAAAVYADVRRSKTLSLVLERVTITDTAGTPVSVEGAREPAAEPAAGEVPPSGPPPAAG